MAQTLTLGSLPAPLRWRVAPQDWSAVGQDTLEITAGARTDLFADPGGAPAVATAPHLLMPVTGDFQLSARVEAEHRSTFDAGVLVLRVDEERWAKLCVERSPRGEPMVVSVVTRGVSDDANGPVLPTPTVWLRMSRIQGAFAFHTSADGRRWDLVRYFSLDAPETVEVGLLAQSPTGQGATAIFSHIGFSSERLGDLRGGL